MTVALPRPMTIRRAVLAFLAAVASLGVVAPSAASAAEDDPSRALAERYAPIIAVQAHDRECGDGEPYLPAPVASVLGRDGVVLRTGDRREVFNAPTAADLAKAPADAYLDLPGNALRPGCDYERWFRGGPGAGTPTVYARIATDPEEPGRLALQYWMFWVYNDWNDRHEGDWEMVQIVFEADDAAAALGTEPVEMAVAQHEGSERRDWDRVETVDGRPVVYPGTGSHATYYSPERWFGKSAAAGFGCDDTRGPSTRVRPAVQLMDEADPAFAWLRFEGRWGERRPAFNNGPTGPNTKDQWDHPIRWMEAEGRDGSVSLPPLGTAVTDFFCDASEQGSLLFIRFLDQPWLVAGAVVLVVGLLVLGVRRTMWSPDRPLPLDTHRRNGQILRGGARLLVEHRRRFAPIALALLVAGLVAGAVQALVLRLPLLDDVTDIVGRGNGVGTLIALAAGAVVTVPTAVVAQAASLRLAAEIDEGRPEPRVMRRSIRSRAAATGAVVAAVSLVAGIVPLVSAVLVLLWATAPAAADAEGLGVRAALRRAVALGRGRRMRTLALVLVVGAAAALIGPLVGTMVLLATDAGFGVVNVVAALFAAVLVPWSAVCLRLLHGDAVAAATE